MFMCMYVNKGICMYPWILYFLFYYFEDYFFYGFLFMYAQILPGFSVRNMQTQFMKWI